MNATTLPRLRIVILAAGFSSRLGLPKALARVHGKSLLRRTLQSVAGLTPGKVFVVLPRNCARYRIEARGLDVTFIPNARRAAGLSSSVRLGIERARYSSALLLLPVDLVNLQRRDVAKLVSCWRADPRRVTARRIGRYGGTPLILPRWLYPRALEVAGDIGLRELVSALPSRQRVLLDLPSAASDVDTPQDLRTARRRLRSTSFSL